MNTTLGMSSTVNNGSNSNSNAAELFNPDTVNLTKAKRNHGELMELLDNLSGKLSHVSSTVDKEFLSAYRVHMLTVQAELKSLKNDVSKGEQMLNSDAQVVKLEKESKWFSGMFPCRWRGLPRLFRALNCQAGARQGEIR